jgi:serine protease inhibitor
MKRLATILFLFFLSACGDSNLPEENNPPNLRPLSLSEGRIAQSGNEFAFTLFKAVQDEEQPNTFVSPLSVSMALGMAMNGASEGTQASILATIDYADLSADEVNQAYEDVIGLLLSMDNRTTLGIANSLWSSDQLTLQQSFVDKIKAKGVINGWVEDKTNKKIKNLITSTSGHDAMYLVNAIYFKSNWQNKFEKSATQKKQFTNASGTTTPVDMMFSKGVALKYYDNEQLQLIDIPYGNGQFSMTVLMPHGDINDFVSTLNETDFRQWTADADSLSVELELPRFKMEWKRDLKGDLEALGMKTVGFPHFFEEPLSLKIGKVIHQSFIEVNEEGSEAAAATAISIELTSAPPKPKRITIDKSFVFFVREKHSGVILFMGQLVDASLLQ